MPWLRAHLLEAWKRRGPLAFFLAPVSLLYAALVMLRRLGYRFGLLPSRRLPCAVIVVGNAIAGGSGKTPTTMGIVQHLRARGVQVGVVSRGYGRSGSAIRAVSALDSAQDVGDEPLLIARNTGVPVFVGRDRHAAAIALLESHPHTQVMVCDDGLQHYALYRDIEVCVFDERGVGNGWMLPSGPLREPWPRTMLAATGQALERELVLHTGNPPFAAGFKAQRALADYARARDGKTQPIAALAPPLIALAGIAKPEAFFAALRARGLELQSTLPLADHYDFSQMDTKMLQGAQVLCTEKDAVKLWHIWPQALAVPLVQTLEPAFLAAIDRILDSLPAAKLSFPHGHQTS